jgi:hypothetical protein
MFDRGRGIGAGCCFGSRQKWAHATKWIMGCKHPSLVSLIRCQLALSLLVANHCCEGRMTLASILNTTMTLSTASLSATSTLIPRRLLVLLLLHGRLKWLLHRECNMLNWWHDWGSGGLRQLYCGNLILEDRLVLYHTIERGCDTLISSLNEARVDATGCCASSQCAACSYSRHNCRDHVVRCTVIVIDVTLKHMVHVVGGYCYPNPAAMFRNSIKLRQRVYPL